MGKLRTIVLGSNSGLCNRLRQIAQYIGQYDHIRYLWPKNDACPAKFNELFHPMAKLNVVDSSSKEAMKYKKYSKAPLALSVLDFIPIFPIPSIPNQYIAVHIRRTDIQRVLKKYKMSPIPDEEYFKWIDSQDCDNIFLATDNAKTQSTFRERYKDRLLCSSIISTYGSNISPTRCTSVQHAIIDIHTCIKATSFMGTAGSSFTGEILRARSK